MPSIFRTRRDFMRLPTQLAIVVLASTCVAACRGCAPSQGRNGDGQIVVDASGATAPSLELTVFIGADGFRVISLGANLAPGCAAPGQGVTVPNKDGRFDFAGLTACAVTLKGTPAGAGTAVTISATPATKYQTVVSTMDALRNNASTALFPDVSFGLARSEPATNGTPSSSAPPLALQPAASAPARSRNQPAPQPAITTTEPDSASEGVAVLISKTTIIVDDQSVVPVPRDAELGLDGKYKRSGRGDLYIVPLANALKAWRERDQKLRGATGKDPGFSAAILIADASTPYRLLVEVLFTLGQSELTKFHMMVLQGDVK
jgi:biopolymer transport protein ExbD